MKCGVDYNTLEQSLTSNAGDYALYRIMENFGLIAEESGR